MKKYLPWFIVGILAVVLLWLWITDRIKMPTPSTPPMGEGAPCIVKKDGIDVNGTIRNGNCIPN